MLHRIIASIFGLALLFSFQLQAQNKITGTITDGQNNPLPGANILVKNTTLGTASDKNGHYKITGLKNGIYIIRVSFSGFETLEKQIQLNGSDSGLDFKMTESSIDLNAVVVTGTRTEKSLKNTPVLTQSISAVELENNDATDITQALEFVVPGLEFNSEAQGKSISLQGLDPQYLLFLVDGERIAGETSGDIDYSRINIANIERIEVVKGASSTLYGSNALGGVVNIITKTPVNMFELDASTRYSNYNTQSHRARIGTKVNRFSSQFSVVYDKTDGYDLQEGNTYRTQEREDIVVLNEAVKYAVSNNFELQASVSYMSKNRDNTSENLYDRRNKSFTYGAKANWFINTKSNMTLSWNSDNYELLNKITDDDLVSDYNNLYNNARLLGNFEIADWNFFTIGAEYISENLTAPRNNIEDKTNTDYLFYAQEDIKVLPELNFIAGLRANHNSEYNWHFTPQFSAMYKIWNLTFRGAYSAGYKTPSLKEKYMNFQIPAPGPPMFLVGNENLEPETSNYASLSAEYNYKGISISATAYRNKISNMISANMDTFIMKPGGIIEYSYENMEEVLVKGIDVMIKAKIIKNLLLSGSGTYSKKINEITGKEFENVRNVTGKFNADYNLNIKNYALNLNLHGNYYGGKSVNLMDDTTHEVQKVNLESFSVWRLTSTHRYKSKYFIRLGVDNIFNFVDESGGYNSGNPGTTFFVGIGLKI